MNTPMTPPRDAILQALQKAEPVFSGALLNSPDPTRLVRFYAAVFGGEWLPVSPVGAPPEWHWRTPGYAPGTGPVLMVRACPPGGQRGPLRANELGYAHLCFEAEDVGGVLRRLLAHGGTLVSTLKASHRQPGVYAADPDGNLIEIHLPFPSALTPRSLLRVMGTLLRIKLGLAPAPGSQVRFIHVNVVVPDWQNTLAFYQQGLAALPHGRLRNYKGPYIGQLIGIPGSAVSGRHVALAGYPDGGPTFEVFTYNNSPVQPPRRLDDIGIIATEFRVHDLQAMAQRLVHAGAQRIEHPGAGTTLLQDPNGNFIRLRPV